MKQDNLYTGTEAREKLMIGIKKVASAVGATMGTGGSNAVLEAMENPGHLMTNDGFSIANSIKLADPIEEMGRRILVEAINRANKSSGDGSSTTAVLTAAIIEEGLKHLGDASPMDIKRSLEACLPLIEASIAKQKRELFTDDKLNLDVLKQVATISSEDEGIGNTIAEIYAEIGKSGIIQWDISKTAEDTYTIGSGLTIEGAGYLSPYMCDIDEKTGSFLNGARWKNPKILLTKQKIASAAEFNELFQALYNQEVREVVVFCDDIEAPVIPDLIKTRAMRGFKTMVVKMPVLWRDQWYEDLARTSGATVIDPVAGLRLKDAKPEHLGTFGHVTVTKEDTFIDGIKDVSEYVAELEKEATDDSKLRASRLNTKTARYFVGAHSDSALSYRRLKVEDAISAAWQALNGGIVPGGGATLLNVSAVMPKTVGGTILKSALEAPARQIYANAGVHVDGFLYSGTDVGGLDTRIKEEVPNMFDAGIIDPANIVLNACKNAVSVAAAILTANTVVTLPVEDMPYGMPGQPVLR